MFQTIAGLIDVFIGAATILGGAVALLGLGAAARGLYRRTLGRRRDRYERLGRLGIGAQLSFFISVLGEPPAIRRTLTREVTEYLTADDPEFDPEHEEHIGEEGWEPQTRTVAKNFTECFFIDRDFYVQTISDEDQTVLAFSITSRHRRFAPRITFPPRPNLLERIRWERRVGEKFVPSFDVRLGRSRFSDLDAPDEGPWPKIKLQLGARTYSYSELRYLGNPGYYQTFAFTASTAVWTAPIGEIRNLQQEIGDSWPGEDPAVSPDWNQIQSLKPFRRATVITSYTVIGNAFYDENFPSTFGPHGDEVRTIP